MTATDTRAFLAEILAHPEEDFPRLVYSDFLEENGDPHHAEFIRVGIAIARICEGNRQGKPEPDADSLDSLMSRESELMYGVWEKGWCGELPYEVMSNCVHNRGFLAEVRCTASCWLAHGREVCAAQPVSRVVLDDREPDRLGGDWIWGVAHRSEMAHSWDIPGEFARFMTGDRVAGVFWSWRYPTREAALADLSAAALAFAKAAG